MINNNQLLIAITVIIIFLILISFIIALFVVKSRNKIHVKELEKRDLKIKYQADTLNKIIIAQEEERKRIARDLHDDISSKLIAISLNLHLLNSHKTKESEKEEIINNTFKINEKTIETSRKIAHHLYPPSLSKFGLGEALKEVVLDYNKTKAVLINLTINCAFTQEVNNMQLQIFRIIQELINNSIKHGKAKKIMIDFKVLNGQNSCFYEDDGVGFDSSMIEKSKGLGFSNIENRIQNIKGTFEVFSEKNKGFKFKFTF